MNLRYRIRIFQPIIPEYRVALFNGIGKRYGADVEVWASDGMGPDKSYPLKSMRYDYAHPFKRFGPICWQSGLSLRGLQKRDVIVICGDIHQFSSLWIALKAKLRGVRVVWWGHHKTATSKPFGVSVRLAVAKMLSDVFLCYTQTGVCYLKSRGFKSGCVFATGNTIDQEPIKDAMRKVQDKEREDLLGQPYFLCCGVLREKMRLDLFLRAMADKRLADVNLAVIGDGPMKVPWQKLAEELSIHERVVWIPGTRDQMAMAPWFLGAKAFVYPGAIGLSILHSFSYGLPVITHGNIDRQMPEFEVMEDGKTGVCFTEGDVKNLIEKVVFYLSNENRRKEMSKHCQNIAFSKYTMDNMVLNFIEAIEAAHRL